MFLLTNLWNIIIPLITCNLWLYRKGLGRNIYNYDVSLEISIRLLTHKTFNCRHYEQF